MEGLCVPNVGRVLVSSAELGLIKRHASEEEKSCLCINPIKMFSC